jgi:putative transposase
VPKPYTVAEACQVHGVTPQAYYQKRSRRKQQDMRVAFVIAQVKEIRSRHPRMGGRKLYRRLGELLEWLRIGRDKFFEFLRDHNLLVRSRRRRTWTTDSNHPHKVYENLLKDVEPTRAAQVFQSDITYLRLQDSFAFASLVTDAYSRKIVGYVLWPTLEAAGPLKALREALRQRANRALPLIHHSDQGVQYCSKAYTDLLKDHGVEISMSEKGKPYQNAIAERVNGILKDEYGLDATFESIAQARRALKEAVTLYNTDRPHLSLGHLTPDEVHQWSLKQAA